MVQHRTSRAKRRQPKGVKNHLVNRDRSRLNLVVSGENGGNEIIQVVRLRSFDRLLKSPRRAAELLNRSGSKGDDHECMKAH